MPTETMEAELDSVCRKIRAHLENERLRVNEEIRNYPRPIPACDAQFNYLLEERVRIAEELERFDGLSQETLPAETRIRRADEFMASSNYIDGATARVIRSSG